jgi:predicted outer membrane repeat protein
MKRILTMLAGVSLVAGLFAAAPAPAKAIATGGWLETPDVVVAPRDRNVGPEGTCNNPDYTSINAAIASLDDSTGLSPLDAYVLGVCKGTYIQRESITLYDGWTFVGEGASKTVIDGSKLEYYNTENDGIIEDAFNGITVANITFKGGAATYGGAIYTVDDSDELGGTATGAEGSDFRCIASSFINNTATDEGGAIYAEGDIYLNRCTFRNNTALNAGGAIYSEQDIVDYGSTYTLNTADSGGAVAEGSAFDGPGGIDNTIGFYGSTFTKNSAVDGNGGAIAADHGDTFIWGSKFIGNAAVGDGGAISKFGCAALSFIGSDIPGISYGGPGSGLVGVTYDPCVFEISDSQFTGNSAADLGGAIANLDFSTGVLVTGSTFQLNRADGGAAIATIGAIEAGGNQFVRNSAGFGVIAHLVNRTADYCLYGFVYNVQDGNGALLEIDLDEIYFAAVLDASDRVDLSGNRFSRNGAASVTRLNSIGIGEIPSWVPVYSLTINPLCVGGDL